MSKENPSNNILPSVSTEESMLKQEMNFIQEEFKSKIVELKKLKEELKKVKTSFNEGLNEYNTKKNATIEKEREIELLLSKVSKMKKLMYFSLNQTINKKFYDHLLEISNNKQKEKILLKIFNFIFGIYNYSKIYALSEDKNLNALNINDFIDECLSIQELLIIMKNENEIRNILFYMYEIFHNLEEENQELCANLKNSFLQLFNDMGVGEKMYPFDFLMDYIKNIFSIIYNERNIEELKIILNNLMKEKNEKFIEIKSIESIIKTYNRNIKIINNYVKALKTFYYKIKERNKNNNDQNTNGNNNKEAIKDLIDDIEKFKKITLDYDKLNSNFDAMTSLSFGTNYTLSEKSSIKSSIMDSKNNNDDMNNETKSELNENNDKISKDLNINSEVRNNNNNNNDNNKIIIRNIIIERKNDCIKFHKSVENKAINKNENINTNKINSFMKPANKNKRQNMKKDISFMHNNIFNLTSTDINSNNKSQIKKQLNIKNASDVKSLDKKGNNISNDKNLKNKNISNKKKIFNTKNNFPIKINAQKILNKEIKKRFNSNNIKGAPKNNSQKFQSVVNFKNKSQIFESKNNKLKQRRIEPNITNKNVNKTTISKNIQINKTKNPKNQTANISIPQNDTARPLMTLNNVDHISDKTIKLLTAADNITEKEFDSNNKNIPLILLPTEINHNHNQRYDFEGKNKYNISKKIEQLKQKENEEYIEITMPNKENNMNEKYFDSNDIKDSICDEMITQNFGTANSLIRSTTNDYINRLGFKNNVLWSENLYKNKAMKFKSNFKKLNIEKPIDTSSCCAACT